MRRHMSEKIPPPWNFILPHAANLFAWGVIAGLLYLLRSFFLLIFLTFVFAYLQTRVGARLAFCIPNRCLRVIVVAFAFICVMTAVGIFLVPRVKTQTQIFVNQLGNYISRMDEEIYRLAGKYPLVEQVLSPYLADDDDPKEEKAKVSVPAKGSHAKKTPAPEISVPAPQERALRASPTTKFLQQLFGLGDLSGGAQNINRIVDTLSNVGGKILTFATNFLLSLLFSFLIVLDMPSLGRNVQSLADTRLRFIYQAVGGNIRDFSMVLGRALEAQLIIAIINSILTAIGISMLGLGTHVAFLAVIVFIFSFFPVVGVFISSIPICLVALQSKGLHTMLMAVVLIIIIHLIEGYILNPRVYGSYMRINSVIILIILTLASKLFGFWGLLLGVPVCTYIFGYAIKLDRPKVPGFASDGAESSPEKLPHSSDLV
ncbi:MAG: AI-2E family transporter [Deltaproteobacteria bacterium]|nr:AI-2E family transporter [Deltaproteobacteria bacterium]